jgi:hypothetical protein
MHVHAKGRYADNNRIKPEHRTALLALASRRGEKGFSAVLGEAIENFLQGEMEREKRRKTLLSLGGSLSKKDGEELARIAKELRESWRWRELLWPTTCRCSQGTEFISSASKTSN